MRQTPNGVSLARFSIAVNRRFAGKDAHSSKLISSTVLHGVRQVNLSQDISKRAV